MDSIDRYEWLDELPLAPGAPDLRMGIRSLDTSKWLLTDSYTEAELALRKQLLAEHEGLVARLPGFDNAEHELLDVVADFVGVAADHSGDPLAALALMVPEDLCLMARDETTWRLVGGTLLFGNQWSLADKLGGTLFDIHQPIDGYGELLESKVERFFDNIVVGKPVWRRNWFVHGDDTYHQPVAVPGASVVEPAQAATLFVRSERETLVRLPESGTIAFSIKTLIAPMPHVKERPQVAEAMARYLAVASDRALRGKDAENCAAALVTYLRSARSF